METNGLSSFHSYYSLHDTDQLLNNGRPHVLDNLPSMKWHQILLNRIKWKILLLQLDHLIKDLPPVISLLSMLSLFSRESWCAKCSTHYIIGMSVSMVFWWSDQISVSRFSFQLWHIRFNFETSVWISVSHSICRAIIKRGSHWRLGECETECETEKFAFITKYE